MKKIRTVTAYILSVAFIFLLWICLSQAVNAELILPGPVKVFKALLLLLKNPAFYRAFAYTFGRVLLSFLITVLLGSLVGLFCGLNSFAKAFFELPLAIIRATPVVAFILIALFWFKSGTVPVFVSVLMSLPIMTTAVCNGFYKSDEKLLAMSKVFCFTKHQLFTYIQLPTLIPFFMNGMLSTFGLTWKVIAAGEVLSLPKNAAGTMLQKAQVHLETSTVIAVTIVLVLVSFLIERLFMLLVKNFLKKRGF